MGVSKNRGTPKSSILTEFSIINHPFWGTPIFGNTHIACKAHTLQRCMCFSQSSFFLSIHDDTSPERWWVRCTEESLTLAVGVS